MKTHDTPTDVMVHFALASLKNLKVLWDTQAQERTQLDWENATRRVNDETLDALSQTVSAWHKAMQKETGWDAFKVGAVTALDGTQQVLGVAAEEAERIHVIRTRARLAGADLAYWKKQIELSFDALNALDALRKQGSTSKEASTARPGMVTRVDIDSEAYAASGRSDRHERVATH
jgi:hypothetical protein